MSSIRNETLGELFDWICGFPDRCLIEELHYLESLIDDSVACESALSDVVTFLYYSVLDEICRRFCDRVEHSD